MTDAEIDALAKTLLAEVIPQIESLDPSPLYEAQRADDGDWLVWYAAESHAGDGTFVIEYSPLEPAKKIVKECIRSFEEFKITVTNPKTGESFERKPDDHQIPESKALGIRTLASCAIFHLIGTLRRNLCDLCEDVIEDSVFIADAVLHATAARALTDAVAVTVTADLSDEIEKLAQKSSERRRASLRHIGQVDSLIVERAAPRRGGSDSRVPVTDAQCITFAENYPTLLQHWKGVASLRRQGLEWRGYAKLVPDTPDDLLDKLDNPLPQESDSEGADYPNIPSVLAHEHSARRCGIPPNTYKHSTLKNLRAKGDKLRSQIKIGE